MSWKDYLTPAEQAELEAVADEKTEIVERYNAVWKKLKTRCDARMRRDRTADEER
ncbi:MAG: hypothetical protein AAF092_05025 [Pseudomonadota bacterium]